MASPVSDIKPLPAARTAATDRRLRLDDILKLMVADGLLPAAEAEKLSRARVHRFEHPLEFLADQHLRAPKPPHKPLGLEQLVEWLAGKLGVPYAHIDPLKIDV